MTIRASDSAHLSLLQTLVNQNRAQYNKLTEQISSGNKYLKRSDDAAKPQGRLGRRRRDGQHPVQGERLHRLRLETASYSYISDMSDQFKKAYSLATEANNTVEQTSGWSEIATELGSCIDSLLSDANAKYLGTSLFAGTNTGGADPSPS
jgi:flagellin-like hook-associated protein FlgL